ncbi:MAG: CRISPR-associated endonuclease Cas1 [Desulfurococcaceae archaeon]
MRGSRTTIDEQLSKLPSAQSVEEVRGIEAQAAKQYWVIVAALLPEEVGFKHRIPRSRMVPGERLDSFNLALNVGYGVLRGVVWKAIFMAGLNPYISFLHKPRAGKMTLVFDLMEEFRPIVVDRPLLAAFRRDFKQFERLAENDREAFGGLWLTGFTAPNHP